MKFNIDFYDEKKDDSVNKEINHYEKQVLEILQNSKSINYENLFDNETYTKTINKLSSINCNTIKWYDFHKDSEILDITNNYGITCGFLIDKVKEITCVIPSKYVAKKVSNFFTTKENIEIINANLNNIKFTKKYDYIIFSDELKKYLKYFDNDISIFLKFLVSLLNDDGKLLFITDNCFGIKYISGAAYKNDEMLLYSKNNKFELPSRNELKVALEKADLNNYIFYYPLPDFNITNVIFSDNYLPKSNMSKLMYNLNYTEGSKIILNELETLKKITEKNEFTHFANSYFIEISKNEKNLNQIRFVSYNNLRKEKYRLITKMYDTYVEKKSYSDVSNEHISKIDENIKILEKLGFNLLDEYKLETNSIISKYIEEDSLNLNILEKFNNNEIFDGIQIIKKWYEYIYNLLIKDSVSDIKYTIFDKANLMLDDKKKKKLHFTKNGFIDLVFENTFCIKDKYYIYDQEWNYSNCPIEFILYRAINNLYSYDFNLENIISKNKLFEKFNIIEFIEEFDELEKYIQEDIIDNNMIKFYSKSYNYKFELEKNFDEFIYLTDEMKKVIELKDKLFVQKQGYEKDIEELNEKLNNIYNSKSWKFIEKIKKIRGRK